jgi:hypothetical protein
MIEIESGADLPPENFRDSLILLRGGEMSVSANAEFVKPMN